MTAEMPYEVEVASVATAAPEMSVIVPCYHEARSVASNLELPYWVTPVD